MCNSCERYTLDNPPLKTMSNWAPKLLEVINRNTTDSLQMKEMNLAKTLIETLLKSDVKKLKIDKSVYPNWPGSNSKRVSSYLVFFFFLAPIWEGLMDSSLRLNFKMQILAAHQSIALLDSDQFSGLKAYSNKFTNFLNNLASELSLKENFEFVEYLFCLFVSPSLTIRRAASNLIKK